MRITSLLAFLLVFSSSSISADFDYPELMVTPSHSKRLETEARSERKNALSSYWPMIVSGATTLGAGVIQSGAEGVSDDKAKNAMLTGVVVGGAWIGIGSYFSFRYSPYSSSNAQIKSMTGQTKKDQLERERIAMEGLQRPASTAKKMIWLSAASNLLASAYVVTQTSLDTPAIVAITASALPILFPPHWLNVFDSQREYEKKIYGPVAQLNFAPIVSKNQLLPGAVFNLRF